MAGILFLNTRDLETTNEFYLSQLGMQVWLAQDDCSILQHGNFLLGFCQRETVEPTGILTFFYNTQEEVDILYSKLEKFATSKPVKNSKYGIYHFFLRDPESRKLEIQAFLDPASGHMNTEECLMTRRSIRHFQEKPIPMDTLNKILEIARFSPTSKNSESYYFVVIQSGKKLDFLGGVRGTNSSPIARAPMAIAICSDPTKSRKPDQDACIAAYHFMIAAWHFGLGTCWIASMDTEEVKTKLGIPQDHYIATITPLGFPAKIPVSPPRRDSQDIVRFTEDR